MTAAAARMPSTDVLPLRHHHLRLLGTRSPAHCLHARLGGDDDGTPSPAMELGSAVHRLALGAGPVVAWEDGRPRRGKEYDAWAATLDPAALVVTARTLRQAEQIAAAARPHLAGLTVIERTIIWEVRPGVHGRATPDAWTFDEAAMTFRLVELKTTADAHPDAWQRTARRLGYATQVAWYRRALSQSTDPASAVDCRIVVVEADAPHAVALWRVTDEALDVADRTIDRWLDEYEARTASGEWPDYGEHDLVPDERDVEIEDLDGGDAEVGS